MAWGRFGADNPSKKKDHPWTANKDEFRIDSRIIGDKNSNCCYYFFNFQINMGASLIKPINTPAPFTFLYLLNLMIFSKNRDRGVFFSGLSTIKP